MNTAQIDPIAKQFPSPVVAQPPALVPTPTHQAQRNRWWIYPILLLVVAGFAFLVVHLVQASKASAQSAGDKQRAPHDLPVVVATVRLGDMDQYLLGLGTVTPLSTVTLKSRVDGEIQKINFVEGQNVNAGDFLMQIDPRPYDAALKMAQGQLAKDTASKTSAEWAVKEDGIALQDKGISQQQLINDTATRDNAIGAIEVDQANIDAAQLNLTYAHITSPITGRIGLRLVDLGNIVHATDTTGLVVITQLQPITVVFNLPEDNLDQIQQRVASGQPLTVDAYDRDLTKKIATGTLLALDNEIDPTTGTVKLKAQFDNKDSTLFPSQFVNARFLVNTVRHAVLVPSAGIQHSPTSTFAYVVTPTPPDPNAPADPAAKPAGKDTRPPGMKGIVAMRDVTTGASQAAIGSDGVDTTVVLSGLEPGDIIVTDGVDKLQDGSKVIARQAPAPGGSARSTTRPSGMGATTQPARRFRRQQNAE
jgi:multidrug efflux system membrane fusion protein